MSHITNILKEYPWFCPLPNIKFNEINKIKSFLPKNSRVIFESFNSSHLGEGENALRNYLASFCNEKNIEFVNQYFILSLTEPELSKKYLNNFNCSKLNKNEILKIIKELGASHIICFSNKMERVLKYNKKLFTLEKKYNYELFKLFNLSFDKISILK